MALPTETTPVAKSLHTLKVIEQVAAYIDAGHGAHEQAITQAMGVLGLAGRPDPYGLRDRALANLIKNSQKADPA
jgi:hypothetical protein